MLSKQDARLAIESHFEAAYALVGNSTPMVALSICIAAGIRDEDDACVIYDLIADAGGPDEYRKPVVVYQSPNWKD